MKWYEYLLFPFSLLYGTVMAIRNWCFSKGIFSVYSIEKKSIVIGNLSVGGTGKSPHVLYLANVLKSTKNVATLSRGYGRKTKGYRNVNTDSTAEEVGDEPLMFKKRLGDEVVVAVDEKRARTTVVFDETPSIDVVLLDDAYQHRAVKAGFSILLTDFQKPYYKDYVLPAGRLREFRCGKKRADCLIVTKSPETLTSDEKYSIAKKLKFNIHSDNYLDKVFFSHIVYGDLYPFGKEIQSASKVLLVTGIANPKPLENYLKRFYQVESLVFPDHHNFTRVELSEIHAKFDIFDVGSTMLVTTEKDFVRISPLLTEQEKGEYPWFYQAIDVKLDRELEFNELINNYVRTIPTIS